MRRAGDVCFSEVFRDGQGKLLVLLYLYPGSVSYANCYMLCLLG